MRRLSPLHWLWLAACLCALVATGLIALRTQQLELGLTLQVEHEQLRIEQSTQPEVPAPSQLLGVQSEGQVMLELEAADLIEDPDGFDQYEEMRRFFARQSEIARRLERPDLELVVRDDAGVVHAVPVQARRPSWREVPLAFWFQLCAGAFAFLISVWVLALRPREPTVRLFFAMGAAMWLFTGAAAVYATRELALPGGTFRWLSSLNHAGANLFGAALVGFFLLFPVRLVPTRALWGLVAVWLPWQLADSAHLAIDQDWGGRLPTLLAMTLALVLGAVQWRATRGDPRGRAVLRWLGASVLTGSGLFVATVIAPAWFGAAPWVPQSYAFGFFLCMHVGFALGVQRRRLFELDQWAYALLFWLIAGVTLCALDVCLALGLEQGFALSTAAMVWLGSFLYLPLRGALWARVVSKRSVPEHELFDGVLQVTFALDAQERERRYRELLLHLFSPSAVHEVSAGVAEVSLREEGVALELPAVAGVPAQRLELPWQGRALFGPQHARLAESLVQLMRRAEGQREAFERGVREERTRIAHELHDDIGASLLSSLYRDDLDATREAIHLAIRDVRSVVHELTQRQLTLGDVLGELRHETMQRLVAAKIAVDWPLRLEAPASELAQRISYPCYRHLTSSLRELTSNAIRHAGAAQVRVRIELAPEALELCFADDGRGFEPATAVRGHGLSNLELRSRQLGGELRFERGAAGVAVRLRMPWREGHAPAPPAR